MKKKKVQFSMEKLEPFFERLSKLSTLYRVLICIVAYALLVAPFVWFSYLPKYETIGKLEKEYEDLGNKLRVAQAKARQLDRMEAMLAEAREKFDTAKRKLPQEREIPGLLTSITEAGQKAGLRFVEFTPMAEMPEDFYSKIPVKINVVAGYRSLAYFFYELSQLPRIVNLKDISISPSKDKKDQNDDKYVMSGTVLTYMFVKGE